jgi:hypothetical protein
MQVHGHINMCWIAGIKRGKVLYISQNRHKQLLLFPASESARLSIMRINNADEIFQCHYFVLRNVFQLEGRGYDIKSQPAKHHNYFP